MIIIIIILTLLAFDVVAILCIYRRLWLPLYGPCVTAEHSDKEGGKPEYLEKNSRSQIEIDKSQPTYGAWELIPSHGGGKREQ